MRRRRKKSSKPFPKFFAEVYGSGEDPSGPFWYVYVIQTTQLNPGQRVGFTYVGATNCPSRRFKQHNGVLPGGARFTSRFKDWQPRALYGPYKTKVDALKAEWTLKQHRGQARIDWVIKTARDALWRRGFGPDHPWVSDPTWVQD